VRSVDTAGELGNDLARRVAEKVMAPSRNVIHKISKGNGALLTVINLRQCFINIDQLTDLLYFYA
jgi:hypothetical protein